MNYVQKDKIMNRILSCKECGSDCTLSEEADIENQQYKKHIIWCEKCGNAVIGSSKGKAMLLWNARGINSRLGKLIDLLKTEREKTELVNIADAGYRDGISFARRAIVDLFPELKGNKNG